MSYLTMFTKAYKSTKRYIGLFITELGGDIDRMGSKLTDDVAYMQIMSRHRNKNIIDGSRPQVDESYVANNSTLAGEVHIGSYSSIGFNVVMRADAHPIRVGNYCYIGDNSNFLTWFSTPIGVPGSIYIGNHCIIEPGCSFGSCIIDENVFIGARSIISPGVKIERGAVIAPNSYIPPGRLITSNSLWAGNPVKLVRELQEEEVHSTFIKSYDYWLQTAEKIKQSELDSSSDLQIRDEVNDYVTQNYFNWRAKYYH